MRSDSYSANSKNQYTSRGVPAYIEVHGIAKVDATVTVEGSSSGVYRRGEYFRKELNVSNASAAQYPTIDVDTEVTSPVSGEKFLPLHPESFSHDTDGNLTQDGRWDYVWDGENRLVKLRSRLGSPATERRLEFEYDWQGRRIRQTVWNDRDDGQGTEVSDTLYLYDGWNLLAELNANSSNAKVRTYIWGLDLSGTMQGAGGVGGLLMVIDHTGTAKRHYAAYDGNGNVTGLADSTTGDWSARYDYGPFGEPIRANGDLAYANPIRWSSKYTDNESGLVYYGYRTYNPSTGRWLSRDPIGEYGGVNMYSFVRNEPTVRIDPDGTVMWLPMIARCIPCKCKKVTLTIDPNARPQIFTGFLNPGQPLPGVGIPVSVQVEVDGDISKCKCRHYDFGGLTLGWPQQRWDNRTSDRDIPCTFSGDQPGVIPVPIPPFGQHSEPWRFEYDLTITVSCTDSDGTGPINGSATLPTTPFWFHIATDRNGNVTAPEIPPQQ